MTTLDRRSFLIQSIITALVIPLAAACKKEEPEQEAIYGQPILTELSDIHLSQELLQDSAVALSKETTYTWGQAVVRDLDQKILSEGIKSSLII